MNTTLTLSLVGGGGHALVVAESAAAAGFNVLGFFDDDPHATLAKRLYLQCLGRLDDAARLVGPRWVIALGGLAARRSLLTSMAAFADQSRAVTIVNPSAIVSASAEIGAGTLVGPRALVHSFARVGDHSIINSGAIVEHECVLGENCHIAPGTVLAGRVTIGPDTLVGLGARVLPGVRIGSGCTVGAGAVVVSDVPDRTTVLGVPARTHMNAT